MRKLVFGCAAMLVVCLSFHAIAALAQRPSSALIPYDNFKTGLLDASKWDTSYGWCGSKVLECVREIQNNGLKLETRSIGATNSNAGNSVGSSELHFANPEGIRTIAAQLTVRRAAVTACAANSDLQSVQALLVGNFFNTGSGDPNDDMQAFFDLEHYAIDPPGQMIAKGFLKWQGQFFGGAVLGYVKIGQPGIAKLSWDPPNNRFILSWTDLDSGTVMQTTMSYSVPSIAPTAVPDKALVTRTFSPNCIGTSVPYAFGESKFDAVWIGLQ